MADACTWFPEQIGRFVFHACCVAHDAAYDAGQFLTANIELAVCFAQQTNSLAIGVLAGLVTTLVGWIWFLAAKNKRGK